MSNTIHVAVAILQRKNDDGQNEFLLASRPHGKGWAGWWEFPGGKIEAGETPEHALVRELQEELGITPTLTQQWLKRRFDYPAISQNGHDSAAKTVLLHFYFVNAWQGEITPNEGQQLSWQNAQHITVSPVLPANAPIMQALALPPIYAISNMAEMGERAWLNALETQLINGLRLMQLREKQLASPALMRLAGQVLTMASAHDAKVLINTDVALAQKIGALYAGKLGVHLSSLQLMQMIEKPVGVMVAASCHNTLELAHAQHLGLDFVVLSPVLPTKSHENAATLGWDNFKKLLENSIMPVYALGGMQMLDLDQALSCGARGIAMQRAIWQ